MQKGRGWWVWEMVSIGKSSRTTVVLRCWCTRGSPASRCSRSSLVQHYRWSLLRSCHCCSLFCSPRQEEQRQAQHHERLCRLCVDLPADGKGQPESAAKRLWTSFRHAGNCTHLPYIIWEQQPLLPDLMPFMPFLLWYQLEIDFETEARG